jgi:hypothetical protein
MQQGPQYRKTFIYEEDEGEWTDEDSQRNN